MADVERVSRVLRWLGALFVVAGGVNAFMPVEDCGNVVQPNSPSSVVCSALIADQWETVWLLGGVGVVLMLAGQVAQWRKGRSGGHE